MSIHCDTWLVNKYNNVNNIYYFVVFILETGLILSIISETSKKLYTRHFTVKEGAIIKNLDPGVPGKLFDDFLRHSLSECLLVDGDTLTLLKNRIYLT